MSIANYTELKAAIAAWMNRDTLTARIPDFITLAESRMTRLLRLRGQETLATTTYGAANTTRRVSLPTGFIELLSLSIKGPADTDENYKVLEYKQPEDFVQYWVQGAGEPERYTVREEIALDRLAGAEYTLRMHYLKGLDIATDTTNSVLTQFPDLYLYGSLTAAEPFIKNDKRLPMWKGFFDEAIREVNKLDDRTRDQVVMTLDPRIMPVVGYDIRTNR